MEIFWKYIDKRAASIAALKDRASMQYIIDHTDEEIKQLYESVTDPGGINLEKVSPSGDIHAGETRIASVIDRESVLRHRYEEAWEYMKWFNDAWNGLSKDDQYILEEFYGKEHDYGDAAIEDLAEHFNIERSSAYRRKNRAVERLTLLLYGL